MNDAPTFPRVYADLVAGSLSAATVRSVFDAIFAGAWTPIQIAGFIAALRAKGETAEMLAAAARAMRAVMVPVEHGLPRVLDTCGTGGDGLGTLNLSTGAALIVASLGVPVAKHGNRAASSLTGSADVLEALGIPIDLPASAARRVLEEAGIAFLLAPTHHPAMRHAGPARKELGIRTIFNCLGPLSNPASATHQLVGAPDETMRHLIAGTLAELGTTRAWVVRGADGLDEISPAAVTRVAVVVPSGTTELEVAPEDFGVERISLDAIRGGDARTNAGILEKVLSGAPHPSTPAFVLNAAAALVVAEDLPPRKAADAAREALASGAAARALARFREVTARVKAS
jgi:anthranilate phosphoribosyltransferase